MKTSLIAAALLILPTTAFAANPPALRTHQNLPRMRAPVTQVAPPWESDVPVDVLRANARRNKVGGMYRKGVAPPPVQLHIPHPEGAPAAERRQQAQSARTAKSLVRGERLGVTKTKVKAPRKVRFVTRRSVALATANEQRPAVTTSMWRAYKTRVFTARR